MLTLHGGRPPSGVGVFARAQSVEWLSRWDFVALNAKRGDTAAKARELMARGVEVWLYSTPQYWTPHAWPAELLAIQTQVHELGVTGFIANPESSWSGKRDSAAALGTALRDAASRTRVGLVSLPMWPGLRACGEACGGTVWAAPENYAKASYQRGGAPLLARWVKRYRDAFGHDQVITAVSAWARVNGIVTNDAASYRTYLAAQPTTVGSIAWTAGTGPAWMLDELREWKPAGGIVHRSARQMLAWLRSPLGLVVVSVLAVVVLVAGVLIA